MKPEIKRKWVKALLSGEYEQCTRTLHDKFSGGYCCLGVLSAITQPSVFNLIYPSRYILPDNIQEELMTINDEGVPFEMIAGLIDEAL